MEWPARAAAALFGLELFAMRASGARVDSVEERVVTTVITTSGATGSDGDFYTGVVATLLIVGILHVIFHYGSRLHREQVAKETERQRRHRWQRREQVAQDDPHDRDPVCPHCGGDHGPRGDCPNFGDRPPVDFDAFEQNDPQDEPQDDLQEDPQDIDDGPNWRFVDEDNDGPGPQQPQEENPQGPQGPGPRGPDPQEVFRCPACDSQQVLRKQRVTGFYFWGCSLFPNCRATSRVGGGNDLQVDMTAEVRARQHMNERRRVFRGD
jgi:hypothetical protein